MELFNEFISTYGVDILNAVIVGLAGYLGIVLKNLFKELVNDKVKSKIVGTCVKAVEQLYKDLHGEEKLQKAIEAASEMLLNKGIHVTDIELRMLIESAVSEFNNAFRSDDRTEAVDGVSELSVAEVLSESISES